jgi:DNA-binding MarR family transcriptional regulator
MNHPSASSPTGAPRLSNRVDPSGATAGVRTGVEIPEVATAAGPMPSGSPAVIDLVMRTFRLNGLFLAAGDALARPAGLTAARWQVLGAVLPTPLSVAGIAGAMGLTRQSVQRIANLLVDFELAVYVENPAHRRAKLLAPTEAGRTAIGQVVVEQHSWAQSLAARIGEAEIRQALATLDQVIATLDPPTGVPPSEH